MLQQEYWIDFFWLQRLGRLAKTAGREKDEMNDGPHQDINGPSGLCVADFQFLALHAIGPASALFPRLHTHSVGRRSSRPPATGLIAQWRPLSVIPLLMVL
jgi:hypothetical protein